ncbi:MAG: ABC transporter substrate-binding protein [Pseudomonadota bacterium]
MRYIFALILFLTSQQLCAAELEERRIFAGSQGAKTIKILSNTDTEIFAPVIEAFLEANPDLNVDYSVANSSDVHSLVVENNEQYDIAISSAMDLQFKLANDGYAVQVSEIGHPDWAQWRASMFGFTMEPAVILLNKQAFDGQKLPQTRQELIVALRSAPDKFRGKIGTYDIRTSGLGYMLATLDARSSESYWRLIEGFGNLNAEMYCCSGAMIDDLLSGKLHVAYNVLGSYAQARKNGDDMMEIITPSDFNAIMMRTALIVSGSKNQEEAKRFLSFLLSAAWTRDTSHEARLRPINSADPDEVQQIIKLEPGLIVHLDKLKRESFLREWSDAILRE